jgi:ureidoacrylate peracid hydrolase
MLAKSGDNASFNQAMAPRLQDFLVEARKVPELSIIFIRTLTDSWTAKPTTKNYLKPGDWLADYYLVSPEGDEPVLTKTRYSAFFNTPLDAMLRNRGVDTLIMTGVGTNVCVESTARDGFMRDYQIVFLSDCTACAVPQLHEATLMTITRSFGRVTASTELLEAWAVPSKVTT